MSARLALSAIGALAIAGLVRNARSGSRYKRKPVRYSIEPQEGEGGLDEHFNDALDLLEDADIKPSPEEELAFVALYKGDVIGALFASDEDGDEDSGDQPKRRFTVVVAPERRGMGIAWQLVEALEESTAELAAERGHPILLEAWVVNPHMAELLRGRDFDEGSRGWSQDDPFMFKEIS